jgi:hypothetical protein
MDFKVIPFKNLKIAFGINEKKIDLDLSIKIIGFFRMKLENIKINLF